MAKCVDSIRALLNYIEENSNAVLSSVRAVQDNIKSMRDCVIKLESEQEKLQERCSRLEHANAALAGEVRDLQQRFQHSRSANVEIIGLPKADSENIVDCLQHIAGVLGL
ncbi:hypothetical protein J6590_020017 [Homalodisca vitripennis]|nr:hypothetical protein J6590_020017 [Homalodisca vitripennis]